MFPRRLPHFAAQEGAGNEIEAEAKATIGLPVAVLENTPPEDLIALFSSRAGTDFPRLLSAAILPSVQGDLLFRAGNEERGQELESGSESGSGNDFRS